MNFDLASVVSFSVLITVADSVVVKASVAAGTSDVIEVPVVILVSSVVNSVVVGDVVVPVDVVRDASVDEIVCDNVVDVADVVVVFLVGSGGVIFKQS